MRVEVCADSITSIQNASNAKVDRVELCSALGIGGLTPSSVSYTHLTLPTSGEV